MWHCFKTLILAYQSCSSAQVSGSEENEDYDHIDALLNSDRNDPLTRVKKVIYRLVKKVGFFGILLCASVSVVFELSR